MNLHQGQGGVLWRVDRPLNSIWFDRNCHDAAGAPDALALFFLSKRKVRKELVTVSTTRSKNLV